MTEQQKWDYIIELDEEFLKGGVILSEWTTFLAKDAESAFCANANLACILACQAAIESHLRYDNFNPVESKGWGFHQLIEKTKMAEDLKADLHSLRRFRNRWVHVQDPMEDDDLLQRPEYYENELFEIAKYAIRSMLRVLYSDPWV